MIPMPGAWPRLVAFCGYTRTGKDTAASVLVDAGYELASSGLAVAGFMRDAGIEVRNRVGGPVAFADLVDLLGYEEAKGVPGVVERMQAIGAALKAIQPDIVMRMTLAAYGEADRVVITGMRSAAEAALVRSAGGVVLRVHRPGVESSGLADDMVDGIAPDGHLINDGTVGDLLAQVAEAMGHLADRSDRELPAAG